MDIWSEKLHNVIEATPGIRMPWRVSQTNYLVSLALSDKLDVWLPSYFSVCLKESRKDFEGMIVFRDVE